MYVVINQKTRAIIGPFETKEDALIWIDRKWVRNSVLGKAEEKFKVERLCSTHIR